METKEIADVSTSTLENNKLIADFMGGLYSKNSKMWGIGNAKYIKVGEKRFVSAQKHYGEQDLKYHSSWDWLMPVLEKCYQTNKNDDWDMWLNDALLTVNIDVLYNKIVEFIKWYNLNK